MRTLNYVYLTFIIFGALNWGLIGFLNFNLIGFLGNDLSKLIYCIIGVCGIFSLQLYGGLDKN